jgi:molybdopterin-dependent oxidoreductase alpha subunit
VNPYLEPGMRRYWVPSSWRSALSGTNIADWWFGVSQGGDIAFIYGTLKVLFENDWLDREFINTHVAGFDELQSAVHQVDWDDLERSSGLPRQAMVDFAGILRDASSGVFVWSMGITQHAFGGDAVQMILNLGLVRGFVGREKCGLMPIRGHSGVQGGAEMGAYATALPGGKPIDNESAGALADAYGFDVPDVSGLSAAEMVEAAHRHELDLLYCVGGNFLRTMPDPEYVARALSQVPLRVHQDIILTDQMLIESDEVILLPAKTRYEQDGGGTETTTERRVIFGAQLPRQVGEARAVWKILRDIAAAVDPARAHLLGCTSGQEIRAEIARIIPHYEGIQRLRKIGDHFQYGGERLCEGGDFNTPDRRAHVHAVPLPESARPNGHFKLSTRRGKQFNTLIYADIDPLTGAARDAVFMNGDDAAEMHLIAGDAIRLVSDVGQLEGRVFLAPIARGNLQVHWPEGNVLIEHGRCDPTGGVPDYNAYVRVEPMS